MDCHAFSHVNLSYFYLFSCADVELNVIKKKLSTKILPVSIFSLLLTGLFFGGTIKASSITTPIIPLEASSYHLPLIAEALRNPSIWKSTPHDDVSRDHLISDIEELKIELGVAKKYRRLEVLENIYKSYVKLSYHLEEVSSGNLQSYSNRDALPQLDATRQAIVRFASEFAKLTKSTPKRSEALYHVLVSQYLTSKSRASAIAQLAKIKSRLNASLARRASFLIAQYQIDRGYRSKATQDMKRIANSLSKEGYIAAHLILARSLAGLNSSGRKVAQKNDRYSYYLKLSTNKARSLSSKQKSAVLAYAIHVWKAGEGRNIDWSRSPINLKYFSDTPYPNAIAERSAITNYKKRRYSQAIRGYAHLSKEYEGTNYLLSLDRRIADIHLAQFRKDKNAQRYAQSLISLEQKYQGDNLPKGTNETSAKAAYQDFHHRHRALVFSLLSQSTKRATRKNLQYQTIRIANNYMNSSADKKEKKQITSSVAKIYVLLNDHRKAVSLYDDLIANYADNDSEKRLFYRLAIESQSHLAKWPRQAPWQASARIKSNDRRKLVSLYISLLNLEEKKTQWPMIAHIGLLQINIGEGEKAFKLWTATLKENSRGQDAEKAAGFMIFSYHKRKNWDDLEEIARLCLSKKVAPTAGHKKLNPHVYLAHALFYGGKEAYKTADYKKAVSKLKEFIDSYRRDTRRDEAYFVIAFSYRGNSQHPESIESLMALVNEYPRSSFYRQSLLHGGEWSMAIAFEEYVINFYKRFVDEYAHDSQAPRVRNDLISLYMGRQLYGEAARIYKKLSQDPRQHQSEKLNSALAYMEIEARFGDKDKALAGANTLLQIPHSDPAVSAKAIGTKVFLNEATINLAELNSAEQKLISLNSDRNSTVMEYLAYVRFLIAEMKSSKTKQEVFNLSLQDPIATLKKHYAIFKQTQKSYETVCHTGPSSYCAPAMYQLAIITQNTIKTIEDISIAETLDQDSIVKFNNHKQSMVSSLAQIAEESDAKSISLVQRGTTTPSWAQQILWSNSKDWNFQGISNESKDGFVQWTPEQETVSDQNSDY